MSLIVLLDAGPTWNDHESEKFPPKNEACKNWLASLGSLTVKNVRPSHPRIDGFGPLDRRFAGDQHRVLVDAPMQAHLHESSAP